METLLNCVYGYDNEVLTSLSCGLDVSFLVIAIGLFLFITVFFSIWKK